MQNKILNHYLQLGPFTNPGCYKEKLINNLPNDIKSIGLLVRKQTIHRVVLAAGNTGSNTNLKYGDMKKIPWYRQAEDDNFPTAAAMLAELYRRDNRGFVIDREEKNRLVVTCRFVSILMASILKSKRIPCRVRSGFASYFRNPNGKARNTGGQATDHWINEYWDKRQKSWVMIDVDGSIEDYLTFDSYDIPKNVFEFSADSWLSIRQRNVKPEHFHDTAGYEGLVTTGWELFHDFHCLMNNEIIYQHGPKYVWNRMNKLTKAELKEIDHLASLMKNPDDNFDELIKIWETKKKFRILKGALL